MSQSYDVNGKNVLVVGLGKSGQAAVRFLVNQGAKVTVTDTKSRNEVIVIV
jgi:UDP-N-acetylmuramoylalanine--D-glutamate ligase